MTEMTRSVCGVITPRGLADLERQASLQRRSVCLDPSLCLLKHVPGTANSLLFLPNLPWVSLRPLRGAISCGVGVPRMGVVAVSLPGVVLAHHVIAAVPAPGGRL
jgi:hypothetical protein